MVIQITNISKQKPPSVEGGFFIKNFYEPLQYVLLICLHDLRVIKSTIIHTTTKGREENTMKFKLNKLTLLLLAAPLAANANVTWSGTNKGIPETLGKVNPDTVNGLVQVGSGSEGSLRIDGGSVVNIQGTLHIANHSQSKGTVTVDGQGSKLTVTSDATNPMNIGNFGNGNLYVSNGGQVIGEFEGTEPTPHFWGFVLDNPDDVTNTTISVTGKGSLLQYPKNAEIRVAASDGKSKTNTVNVLVADEGKLSAGTLRIGNGTTKVQIGDNNKAGTFDIEKIQLEENPQLVKFDFAQTDDFNFTPEIASASASTKLVEFVQKGSGTTLFAPRNMSDINSNVSITNGTLKVGRDNAFGDNSVTSNVNIGENGKLALNNFNATVTNLNNKGTLDLTSDNANKTLTVEGDYHSDGGKLIVKTTWNNNNSSSSDTLHIKGKATGHTVISTQNGFIEGDVLRQARENIYSADIIKIDNPNHQATFSGTAKTRNADEAQLTKKNGTTYAWTLKVLGHDIYIEPATAYIQMPRVNMELGYSVLDTLHQRRGEISQSPNSAVWARVSSKRLETEGRTRLDVDSSQYVAQVGYDFNRSEMQNGLPQSLSGVYFAYSRADSRFYDQYRAEHGEILADKYSGKGKTTAANIGVYHLYRAPNNAYVDTVAQFSYLTNKYNFVSNPAVRQHGWSGALSVEGGHSFALGNSNWRLEPQTQLIYQRLKLQSFYHDADRRVEQGTDNNLRGRIGVRLSHGKDFQRNPTVYFVANVWHDFMTAKSVLIGDKKYGENDARTWLEGGAGLNVPFGNHAIHADLRLEHSLGNKGTRSGAKAVLGYSYAW